MTRPTSISAVLIHDRLPHDPGADQLDVFAQAEVVESALAGMGYATSRLAFSLDLPDNLAALRARNPDLVFNLVESVEGQGRLQHLAPTVLEQLHVPYTGSSPEAVLLTTNKLWTKRLLRLHGLGTPAWVEPGRASRHPARPGTYILKPIFEDASVGVDDDAVVEVQDSGNLADLIRDRSTRLGHPVFAEMFIDGREFNLALLAADRSPEVLPVAEIQFTDYGSRRHRLVGYRAKWDPQSFEYLHTPRRFEFPEEDQPLLAELTRQTRLCWDLFALRGYARVDFRVDTHGRPWILEVNANPCLSPDAGFAAAARQAGWTMDDVVRRIIRDTQPDRHWENHRVSNPADL